MDDTLASSVDIDLHEYLAHQGYQNMREVPGHGLCGILRFMFTVGLILGLDENGCTGRYCYHTKQEASDALAAWDGEGDPPGNWIVYKGKGGQRTNPNRTR